MKYDRNLLTCLVIIKVEAEAIAVNIFELDKICVAEHACHMADVPNMQLFLAELILIVWPLRKKI